MRTQQPFSARGGNKGIKKREKTKGKYAWSAPVYVESVYTSLAVNMKKKKKKKTRRPSEKLTPEPVNKPLAKFINVKQGIVFPLRRRENKKQKGQRH